MATRRKRPAKKAAPKRSNSNIQSAQRAAVQRRLDQTEKRQATQAGKPDAKPPVVDPNAAKLQAAKEFTDPKRLLTKSTLGQNEKPGDTFKGGAEAAQKIAGLASGIRQQHQQEQKRALADTKLYGASDKNRAANLSLRSAAYAETRKQQILTQKGAAVWMGETKKVKLRNRGPQRQDENGNTTSEVSTMVENVATKDELLSWLTDEAKFNQIKAAANKAGIAVESYDDVAKIWTAVVKDAAAAYSTVGKKVTPWALLQLRGKTMKGGKPASKTTVSTSIDEMDPAEAKGMIRNAASQMLGRDPTKEEIEDFIAKAQTIAKSNPNVTTTTTNYGFDGEATSQSSISKGGGDAVTAQAQESALEQAKQSEDYTAYQAAGVYMPWLMDALASPIN